MDQQHNDEMSKEQALEQQLRQLAYQMAQALADLDCPDCCGPVHAFIEHGCEVYREEWEWACLVQVVRHKCIQGGGRS